MPVNDMLTKLTETIHDLLNAIHNLEKKISSLQLQHETFNSDTRAVRHDIVDIKLSVAHIEREQLVTNARLDRLERRFHSQPAELSLRLTPIQPEDVYPAKRERSLDETQKSYPTIEDR
ncbi:hypothetical protein [Effusibacillus dendaii]|uniref:Uncharacterized protein n=1 Tax=Effusibacillus dendaii TaxID=2743772 RepID=A0A7I8DBG9_9BACL|nr:hypothetical protein [Effusibacillus dendaii]BCJ87533.1 hypothetical protein skT53_25180 [Effusibacillus dendaii]